MTGYTVYHTCIAMKNNYVISNQFHTLHLNSFRNFTKLSSISMTVFYEDITHLILYKAPSPLSLNIATSSRTQFPVYEPHLSGL